MINVMNKVNHQILCILLDYRYIDCRNVYGYVIFSTLLLTRIIIIMQFFLMCIKDRVGTWIYHKKRYKSRGYSRHLGFRINYWYRQPVKMVVSTGEQNY